MKSDIRQKVFFFLMTLPAAPSIAGEGLVRVFGLGTSSCGVFVESRYSHGADDADPYNQWIDGFFSGINVQGGGVQTDRAGLQESMLLYCKTHPADQIISAALSVKRQLQQ